MITQEDMNIARRMASRYNGHRFSYEDAFQAAMERLARRNPKDQALRVLEMKKGIAEEFSRSAFQMVVPRSSFDRMKKEGRLPDHLGDLIVDELVFEIPKEDTGFERVEDEVSAHDMVSRLEPEHRRVVSDFMRQRRPGYTTRARDKALLEEAFTRLKEMA